MFRKSLDGWNAARHHELDASRVDLKLKDVLRYP
jgi:hypothetical protein